jgi:rod shape-determining protein MreC
MSIEGIGSAIVTPFQKAYNGIQGGVGRIWAGFSELTEVRNELQKTRDKLQQYESISEDLSEIKKENERLRTMLGMKAMIPYESISASIISKDPDNWFRTLIIDKGSSHGIRVNMPVIAFHDGQKAVVGRIVEVRGSISRILPIISPGMKLGVQLQESRYPGLLYGRSNSSNLCLIDYISRAAVIKFGDIVITSGQGGVFPEGLLVGTAIKSEVLASSAYQRVIIKPAMDYGLLEEVFIIKKEPDTEVLKLIEGAE